MSGLKLAALYGFFPHKLGFCGPQRRVNSSKDSPQENSSVAQIYNFLCGEKVSQKKIREILEKFKGAFSYYRLIARTNRIKNPFNEKVVEAYWIGNRLLEKVKTQDLKRMIITEFSGKDLLNEKGAETKSKIVIPGFKPHHSFHVLVMGSVSGRIVLTKKLVDFCRIGWGRVETIDQRKNKIKVKYQPLIFSKKFYLGKLKEKDLIWDRNILPEINLGNQVSCHWNHVIEVLTQREVENLRKYTQETLDIFNQL